MTDLHDKEQRASFQCRSNELWICLHSLNDFLRSCGKLRWWLANTTYARMHSRTPSANTNSNNMPLINMRGFSASYFSIRLRAAKIMFRHFMAPNNKSLFFTSTQTARNYFIKTFYFCRIRKKKKVSTSFSFYFCLPTERYISAVKINFNSSAVASRHLNKTEWEFYVWLRLTMSEFSHLHDIEPIL